MHCLATAKATVLFDLLPDAAIEEITAAYKLAGSRRELLAQLHDLVHRQDYDSVMSMIAAMQPIAEKYGKTEAVTIHD